MVGNLSDEDILDYLMTSDFNEGLTPDEFKLLLFKFRNFYRVLQGKKELLKSDRDKLEINLEDILNSKDKEILNILTQKAKIEDELHFAKQSRSLSWKERWTGKTYNTNENK